MIDDMLVAGLNEAAAYVSTHVPMTLDAVSSQVRLASEVSPEDRLRGFSSDFSKAYKQIPLHPVEALSMLLSQFCPAEGRALYWVALSLLFGGRLSPI